MATPAENLERIADLASEIRDFTYNSQISLDFIDVGITNLTAEINRNFSDLDSTLVMVGNNIVSQIQMSGSGPASFGAVLSELLYQSALLENISRSLLDIQSVLWKSLKASNMNFNSLADSDCCEKLLAAIKKLISNKKGGGGGDSERDAKSGINSLLDSLKGGIFTAVVGFSKAISKPVAGIIDVFKKAISGEKIDYGQIFMSVAKSLEGIPNAFMSITNFASKFVAMLDPALMGQLALAFQDLMAVVGMGLRPIIQAAIPIVRAFADALLPIMQTLAPVINQFGNAMVKIAIPVIALWAKAIWALIPVLETIAPLFLDIAEIFSVGAPVISIAFDSLSTALQIVVGVVHLFMTAIKIVTVAIMDAAEWVVSWVSKSKADSIRAASEAVAESAARSGQEFKRVVDGLIEGQKPMPIGGQGGSFGAAAKQASYSGIADLGKNMMQAAFGQSQQNAALQTANNTKIMAEGIGKMVGWFLGQGRENAPQQGVR